MILKFVKLFIHGDQLFLDSLQMPLIGKYRKWTYNGLTSGFVKKYKGLTFVTVRGAGHMVLMNKPGPALHLIKILIRKSNF